MQSLGETEYLSAKVSELRVIGKTKSAVLE